MEALPGPCAVTTALSASGFSADSFDFRGYMPKNQNDRETELLKVRKLGKTSCFYENPRRITRALAQIEEIFGSDH